MITIKNDLEDYQVVCFVERGNILPECDFAKVLRSEEMEKYPSTQPDVSYRAGAGLHDLCALMFTSGTTGLPKAAALPNRKYCNTFVFKLMFDLSTEDHIYVPMPMYHGTAQLLGFVGCLSNACTLVMARKFSKSRFWDDCRQYNVTGILYVGEMCRYLLTNQPSSQDKVHKVRVALGNGMKADTWEKFQERYGVPHITEFYSATEGNGLIYTKGKGAYGRGSIGHMGLLYKTLRKNMRVIVRCDPYTEDLERNDKGLCIPVKTGEKGEFLIKITPSSRFYGYFENEKASNKKIAQDVLVKGDSYFRSGDILSVDRDGFYYFGDRIGDTYRWKSENVSTEEVATAIGRFPAIEEPNVYGVEIPKHEGRAGCARLLLKPDTTFNTQDLAVFLNRELPKYAVPLFLRLGKDLVTTGNLKQVKTELRKEGVNPETCPEPVLWLRSGDYVPFTPQDWESLKNGSLTA